MKFTKLHEDSDIILVTEQYLRHYEEALKKNYPNHAIVIDEMVHHGNAYFVNSTKLKEEYEKKKSILPVSES